MRDYGIGVTISGLLASAAREKGNRLAFVCSTTGRTTNFSTLDRRVNQLSRALLSLGLTKGDVVAFAGLNRIEMVEIYFALARTGLVGLPLPPRASARELSNAIRNTGAKALVYEAHVVASLDEVRANCLDIGHFLCFGGPSTDLDYEALIAAASPEDLDILVSPEDPFYFNTTSGTTGLPKLFLLSHAANLNTAPLAEIYELKSTDTVMTVFPLFGRVAFGWALVSVSVGASNVLTDFESGRMLRLIEERSVTVVNVVPTMAAKLLADPALATRRLDSLRAIIFAGAALTEAIRTGTERKLCPKIYEFFGMNELGMIAVSRPGDRAAKPRSVGRLLSTSRLRIIDDEGIEAPTGSVGELICMSSMSAQGYGDPRGLRFEPFPEGWVATGDLGALDRDGYLYIRGRKKDVIVSGGHKVGAAEVEAVLSEAQGVFECAVLGMPDAMWGERVVAVIVVKSLAEAPHVEALEAHCRNSLSAYKVPKMFRFQEEPLPRTTTAKVQKFLLADKLSRDVANIPRS